MSEYEEYQQKYRLFDTALFCLSPDNWFRKGCKHVLTKQHSEPAPLKDSEGEGVVRTVLRLLGYILGCVLQFLRGGEGREVWAQ